jgi:hypothetical protein
VGRRPGDPVHDPWPGRIALAASLAVHVALGAAVAAWEIRPHRTAEDEAPPLVVDIISEIPPADTLDLEALAALSVPNQAPLPSPPAEVAGSIEAATALGNAAPPEPAQPADAPEAEAALSEAAALAPAEAEAESATPVETDAVAAEEAEADPMEVAALEAAATLQPTEDAAALTPASEAAAEALAASAEIDAAALASEQGDAIGAVDDMGDTPEEVSEAAALAAESSAPELAPTAEQEAEAVVAASPELAALPLDDAPTPAEAEQDATVLNESAPPEAAFEVAAAEALEASSELEALTGALEPPAEAAQAQPAEPAAVAESAALVATMEPQAGVATPLPEAPPSATQIAAASAAAAQAVAPLPEVAEAEIDVAPALTGFAPPDAALAPETDAERPQQVVAAQPSAPAAAPVEAIGGTAAPAAAAPASTERPTAAAALQPTSSATSVASDRPAAPSTDPPSAERPVSSASIAAATPATPAVQPSVSARPETSPAVQGSSAGRVNLAGVAQTSGTAAAAAPPPAIASQDAPPAEAAPNESGGTDLAALPVAPRVLSTGVDPDAEIEAVVRGYGCARVSGIYEITEGSVTVSGHLRSESDRDDLLEKLARIPGVEAVNTRNLHIIGEPYCRVLAFLARPEFVLSDEQHAQISAIGDPIQASVHRVGPGEAVELAMIAPDFPSHIYVDYFSVDGNVYHLLPAESLAENRFAPDEQFLLGGEHGRGLEVRAAPPFGLDMVLAIGTSEPLFDAVRPTQEASADYLTDLGAAIDRARAAHPELRLEYAYHLIYTGPAPGQ